MSLRKFLVLWSLPVALLCAACSDTSEPEKGVQKTGSEQSDSAEVGQSDSGSAEEKASEDMGKGEEIAARPTLKKDSPTSSKGADEKSEPPFAPKESEKKDTSEPVSPVAVAPERDSTLGRWIVVISQQGTEFYAWMLEITQAEGEDGYNMELLDSASSLPEPEVKKTEISESSLHAVFGIQGQELDFRGTLKDGEIRGTMAAGQGQASPIRLVATEEKSLEKYGQPQQVPEVQSFQKAQQADAPVDALKQFIEENSESSLALDAYNQIFSLAKQENLDESTIDQLAQDYVELAKGWGDRMERVANVNIGLSLAMSGHLPKVAFKYLDKAEEGLGEDSAALKELIENARLKARVQEARLMVASGNKEEQQQGVESLKSLRQEQPFDPGITYALANHAQKQNNTEEAIDLYAQLAALPFMERILQSQWSQSGEGSDRPLPSQELARLWEEKHGGSEGLEEHLDKVYKKNITSFAEKQVEPRSGEANRIALVELFTGSQCPPCVSADVATAGLEVTYPMSQVIVLRYHQHVPGPDPLTNEDSEARFSYYNGRGTPTLCLNGQMIPQAGGVLPQVENLYSRLRDRIGQVLGQKADVGINLSANAKDGELSLSADVTGFKKTISPDLRLRLVLAEDDIAFVAGNGVRHHEMIVRDMPGSPEGIAASEGQLKYETTINLADFKQQLTDYLAAFEQGQNMEFPAKPLDLQDLHLVAFVQNDATQEVLQAAAIPVSGKLEYPESVQPSQDAGKKKEEAEGDGKTKAPKLKLKPSIKDK